MYCDPSGHSFVLSLLAAWGVGALLGAVTEGLFAVSQGEDFWGGALSGALMGSALGLSTFLGGSTVLLLGGKIFIGASVAGKLGLASAFFATSVVNSTVAGMGGYVIETAFNDEKFVLSQMIREGLTTAMQGALNFGAGMVLGYAGGYRNLTTQLSATESKKLIFSRAMVGWLLRLPSKFLFK